MNDVTEPVFATLAERAKLALGKRNLIFIGLMGAGKSAIGRLTAQALGVPFVDSDHEIERVSRMTVSELFAAYGEEEFRALEARVLKRLLRSGPRVVSTGGGAYINERSRRQIRKGGLTVWLNADLDVLWERVNKRDTRPLLKTENPRQTLENLMRARYPIYAEADLVVLSRDVEKGNDGRRGPRRHRRLQEGRYAMNNHATPAERRVRVNLGDRSYDILIGPGLIAAAGREIASRLKGRRMAVITDENVAPRYLEPLMASLKESGIDAVSLILPAGEKTKSFEQLIPVCDAILAARIERNDAVIALGGGVIGDLTGFAAGIVRRGSRFIQIPTSLLAQVDSSVGGKTGINSPHGKNLIGVFHQPDLVLADTDVLDTLSPREFRAGYAEVAKYGLIDKPEFFDWLERNWQAVFSGGAARIEAIAVSCQAKADVVAADERENGLRALLNLGHTFGHALEAATEYDSRRLVHGEGVAIGMVLAHQFSARMNLASPDDARRVEAHLAAVGLPTLMADIPGDLPPAERLMEAIAQDKKVKGGKLTFILTRGIGQSFVADDVPASEVLGFLKEKHPR
ncbi:3-dehydroquinate synthase [Sinorhizobium fredii]